MAAKQYGTDVFVNCPFDERYQPLFRALLFAVFDCGFRPRCALEIDDASEIRIDKIFRIISESRYGIHDISRTEVDPVNQLPRFNMPLELGMFLAAKRFGTGEQKKKSCLILDREPFRYHKYLSDIAGQDIQPHNDDPRMMIRVVRNWLSGVSLRRAMPGGAAIYERYLTFQRGLPRLCQELRLAEQELTFLDFANLVSVWLTRPV